MCYGKDFTLSDGKPLKGYTHGNDIIRLTFLNTLSDCYIENRTRVDSKRSVGNLLE